MFSHVRHLEAEGKQMASLYQQMAAVEEKLRESKILRRQLENISNAEEERTQRLIVNIFMITAWWYRLYSNYIHIWILSFNNSSWKFIFMSVFELMPKDFLFSYC